MELGEHKRAIYTYLISAAKVTIYQPKYSHRQIMSVLGTVSHYLTGRMNGRA